MGVTERENLGNFQSRHIGEGSWGCGWGRWREKSPQSRERPAHQAATEGRAEAAGRGAVKPGVTWPAAVVCTEDPLVGDCS